MISRTRTDPDNMVLDYFLFSLRLGLKSLRPGFWREPLARIVNPISYVRGAEFSLVLGNVSPAREERVLDIGSPKLPFLYLAARSQATIHATDIRDYFIAPMKGFLNALGQGAQIGQRLFLEVQDARALDYPNGYFDRVFSISAIEHIPEDGDSRAIGEIARTLKPGGTVTLTVPYAHERYSEEFHDGDVYERRRSGKEKIFYQRRYDGEALRRRLIEPSGLAVRKMVYFGEPRVTFGRHWSRVRPHWKAPLLWLQPVLERCLLGILPAHRLDRAIGVAITLEKN